MKPSGTDVAVPSASVAAAPEPGVLADSIAIGALRLGWALAPGRAQQLAASAAPTLARFAGVESCLDFDSDPLSYAAVRDAVRQRDGG